MDISRLVWNIEKVDLDACRARWNTHVEVRQTEFGIICRMLYDGNWYYSTQNNPHNGLPIWNDLYSGGAKNSQVSWERDVAPHPATNKKNGSLKLHQPSRQTIFRM